MTSWEHHYHILYCEHTTTTPSPSVPHPRRQTTHCATTSHAPFAMMQYPCVCRTYGIHLPFNLAVLYSPPPPTILSLTPTPMSFSGPTWAEAFRQDRMPWTRLRWRQTERERGGAVLNRQRHPYILASCSCFSSPDVFIAYQRIHQWQ